MSKLLTFLLKSKLVVKCGNNDALSVQKLALSMESMIEEQKSQGERLAKLESEPGERWSGMTKTIFNTMVGAGSGALAVGIILLMAHYIK